MPIAPIPPYQVSVHSMLDAHAGKPALIVGGGPSTPHEMAIALTQVVDPIIFSVNQHGFLLKDTPTPRYSVCIDNLYDRPIPIGNDVLTVLPKLAHANNAFVITPRHWADIRIYEQPANNKIGRAHV